MVDHKGCSFLPHGLQMIAAVASIIGSNKVIPCELCLLTLDDGRGGVLGFLRLNEIPVKKKRR